MKKQENYHQNIVNMYRVYLFLSLVYMAQAQIPSFGFCPDYLPMSHFDMNRFLGKWYEAERYFQFSEVAARCVVTDYAVGPNGKIYVSNEVTNRFTGVRRVIGGNMDLTGKKTEGRLVVKYDTTPISTTSALTVLDTDYDTYAVIWSCSGLGPVNAQSAWLMTRERIPDATTLQQAYGVLDRYKISRTFFVKTDQEGCANAASDLNAALGIASTSTNVEQNADIEGGKAVKESKAQSVPEVIRKIAEDQPVKIIEKLEVPDLAKTSQKSPAEGKIVNATVEVLSSVNNSPKDSAIPETPAVIKHIPNAKTDSVNEIVKHGDAILKSDFNLVNEPVKSIVEGDEKNGSLDATTNLNRANEKNNDLTAKV